MNPMNWINWLTKPDTIMSATDLISKATNKLSRLMTKNMDVVVLFSILIILIIVAVRFWNKMKIPRRDVWGGTFG